MKAIQFKRFRLAVFICLVANLARTASAQEQGTNQTTNPDKWDFRIGIPLWASGFHGTVGVGNREAHISDDFWDLLDTLDFLAPLNLEIRKSRWLFFSDGFYIKTSTTGDGRGSFSGASVDVDQKAVFDDLAIGYALVKNECFSVEAFAGAQLSWVEPRLSAAQESASTSKFWADPIVGAYLHYPFSKPVGLYAKGDVGGFGVNADLTWQIEGGLDFPLGDRFYARLAYRYLNVDYDKRHLSFDANLRGPQLELGVRW